MKQFEMNINKSNGPLLRSVSACILKTALKERLMDEIPISPLWSNEEAATHQVVEFEKKIADLDKRLHRGFHLIVANLK